MTRISNAIAGLALVVVIGLVCGAQCEEDRGHVNMHVPKEVYGPVKSYMDTLIELREKELKRGR